MANEERGLGGPASDLRISLPLFLSVRGSIHPSIHKEDMYVMMRRTKTCFANVKRRTREGTLIPDDDDDDDDDVAMTMTTTTIQQETNGKGSRTSVDLESSEINTWRPSLNMYCARKRVGRGVGWYSVAKIRLPLFPPPPRATVWEVDGVGFSKDEPFPRPGGGRKKGRGRAGDESGRDDRKTETSQVRFEPKES